ncbi:hypothetical protein [Streptomyces sp. NPDC048603]|uniref:hypothetical protein n=1 Tax=Streptomyces sp. NPDC048603 TaxID=3365577 RepID=UPI003714A338
MNHDGIPARARLQAALEGVAVTFRGMTARPDESNCECHWGSPEELAQLKVPDVELDRDLLTRTWQATDWCYPDAVLRRILPQFAQALVKGLCWDGVTAGRLFLSGEWWQWPPNQAAAVREFLDAWWMDTLTEPDAVVPAHEVLVVCSEASGALAPWLAVWEGVSHPVADRRLADAVDSWSYDLLTGVLPWFAWKLDNEEAAAELTTWLTLNGQDRLRASGAPEDVLHCVRLLSLTGAARWEDPHFPLT